MKKWGEDLHKKIKRNVGMPVSIGLAPNKIPAKMASHFAKKYQGYRHCCMIDSDVKRIKALKLYPINIIESLCHFFPDFTYTLIFKTSVFRRYFQEYGQPDAKMSFFRSSITC